MKRLISAISAASLIFVSLIVLQPATAAANTSLRWDKENSCGFAWSVDNKAANEDYNNFVKYFTSGVNLRDVIAAPGSTINIRYILKDASGGVMANSPVTLVMNPAYSVGTATSVFSDGVDIPKILGDSKDGRLFSLTTDSAGAVAFSVINKDTTGESLIANNGSSVPSGKQYTQIALWQGNYSSTAARRGENPSKIDAQVTQDIDILEIHYLTDVKADKTCSAPIEVATPPTTPTPTPTPTPSPTFTTQAKLPSMRLISPAYGRTNSVNTRDAVIAQYYSAETRAYFTYIPAGTTLTLKYLATTDGTTPLANTEVTLLLNSQFSKSMAHWTSGSNKYGPGSDTASGGQIKAKTNAAGEVTFVVKNTDTTGTEAAPASANAPAPANRLFGTFKPVLTGYGDKDADVDLVTFDVYTAAKPVAKATTITCIKGKSQKKVTAVNPKCPTGYKKM